MEKKDKLHEMFWIQAGFQERMGTFEKIENNVIMRQRFINQMILAVHEEATEIMRETAYKNPDYVNFGWKQGQTFDNDKMKDEIVDLWHFVMNLSIAADMGPDEFYTRYCKKNNINHERQDNNY